MKTNLLSVNNIFTALIGISFASFAAATGAQPLKVFVLAGQSNMVGVRSEITALPENLKTENPDILFFDGQTWAPMKPGNTEAKGFGPEISFARKIHDAWKEPVGIIKHSKGGSMLASNWSPRSTKENLLAELLARVKAAQAAREIEIVGVLWMQGESDAVNEKRAALYANNLDLLIERFRSEFNNPALLFLCARVNPPEDRYPTAAIVRKAQEECTYAHYRLIDCDDLEKVGDNLHYNTRGIIELGNRFADAALKPKIAATP
ncbi:hypothetical protein OPIT5_09215 [Opitutaceae bacterium TAV5]|nr:hypothetical protein OPIT5_09215 [Opitutaceae bacterium TAV5]